MIVDWRWTGLGERHARRRARARGAGAGHGVNQMVQGRLLAWDAVQPFVGEPGAANQRASGPSSLRARAVQRVAATTDRIRSRWPAGRTGEMSLRRRSW